MSKAFYCLKMCLFSKPFELNAKEKEKIYSINFFVVHIYVKYWFSSLVAAFPSGLNFEYFESFILYEKIDYIISSMIIKIMFWTFMVFNIKNRSINIFR